MSFGGQTITFVTVTENPLVRDRYNNPQKVRVETPVGGCRFRPLNGDEAIQYADIGTAVWKGTVPPVSAALTAAVNGEVKEGGVTYQIAEPVKPFTDMSGSPFKVTIICKKVTG